MRAGSVVERGDTGAVLDNPQSEYTRVLRDSVPRPGWHPRLTRSMLSPQDEAE
jgi:ABC-type dipeptide/oligopeptide/nickel transport system ATPase component